LSGKEFLKGRGAAVPEDCFLMIDKVNDQPFSGRNVFYTCPGEAVSNPNRQERNRIEWQKRLKLHK
jgi:hypothetical protein